MVTFRPIRKYKATELMDKITLTRPDDWHLHLRDNKYLTTTVPHSAERFGRAVIMPNLKPPVTTVAMALEYQKRIQAYIPKNSQFQPLMTLYLTDQTTANTIKQAQQSEQIIACKLYPAGATTHSQAGVTDLTKAYPAFAAMEEYNIPLLIHGEVTDKDIDIFDREKYFLERNLVPLINKFPRLRIVLEHITTSDAVELVKSSPATIAATITAHHLLLNRNHMLAGGIRPHHYCLPVLKRREHQQAIINTAVSGNAKFFLGSDSAPHAQQNKETAYGCAGIYTAHAAIELYAEVFAQANALDKLEAFSSFNGADFYGLPRNSSNITLIKQSWRVPDRFAFGDDDLIPFRAGDMIPWKLT